MRPSALLLIPLLAISAAGQTTEKETVAVVKAAAKLQLKAFKTLGKAALTSLDSSLEVLELGLSDASPVNTTVPAVAASAAVFLDSLHDAFVLAEEQVDDATAQALTALQNGGDLQGLYPVDLYYGTGGTLDDFRADLLKAATKLAEGARKRLAKTVKLAEKQAGLGLTFQVFFPPTREGSLVNPGGQVSLPLEPRLDLVVAGSRLETASDGMLVIGGVTTITGFDVSLGYFGPEGSSDFADFAVSVDGRFLGSFGASLPEGGYAAFAAQGTGTHDDAAGIGIR
jgi:hypothetical protein